MSGFCRNSGRISSVYRLHIFFHADLAHLVERHLAKVEVASSSLVGRSIGVVFITPLYGDVAKW